MKVTERFFVELAILSPRRGNGPAITRYGYNSLKEAMREYEDLLSTYRFKGYVHAPPEWETLWGHERGAGYTWKSNVLHRGLRFVGLALMGHIRASYYEGQEKIVLVSSEPLVPLIVEAQYR